MRAIRDVWSELVERRLWPVALLLVVALVAVPVVLAKKPAGGQAPATVATATPAVGVGAPAPGEPVVNVSTGNGGDAPMLGHWKDPFKAPPKPASTTSGTNTSVAGGTPTGGGTGSNGGGTGGAAPRPTKPKPRTYVYASVNVHFGRAGSPLKELKDLPRLAPLPSASDPIVIFMGTRTDHETAVFMLSTDVKVQGDARCVPSTKACEAIELRRGGVALLAVTGNTGFVTQYELDLDDVVLHTTTSQATASAAAARHSVAGKRALHTNATQVELARALHWSVASDALTGTHLVWLTREASGAGARAPEASAGSAASPPVLTPLP